MVESQLDKNSNIYFISQWIKKNADWTVEFLTEQYYSNTVDVFNSYDTRTQSAKLAQSKKLIRETLTPQELKYLYIEPSLFDTSKFGIFFLSFILWFLYFYVWIFL